MSTSPTRASDATAARRSYEELGHGGGCEHCDDSVPHEHVDVRALVETSRQGSRRRAMIMTALAAAALAAALVVAVPAGGAVPALTAAAVTALGWLALTGAGLLIAGRVGGARGVAAGAMTTAGLTPLALLTVAWASGTWPAAPVAAAVWLLAGALAACVQARTWRALLLQPGPAGERARAHAVRARGATGSGEVRRWAVQGLLVGVATALLIAVPPLAVVLVPVAVLLAAWSADRRQRSAQRRS